MGCKLWRRVPEDAQPVGEPFAHGRRMVVDVARTVIEARNMVAKRASELASQIESRVLARGASKGCRSERNGNAVGILCGERHQAQSSEFGTRVFFEDTVSGYKNHFGIHDSGAAPAATTFDPVKSDEPRAQVIAASNPSRR